MKKYLHDRILWILKNKVKSLFLILFIYILACILMDFIRLPGKIDFWLYWKKYQNVIKVFEENKDISAISYEEISWLNWKKSCANPWLKYNDFSRITREVIWISEPCDTKYSQIFDAVKEADVSSFIRVFPDKDIFRIITKSLSSRLLDTSYIYSKWFFKTQNLWKDYPQIINEDWWLYQNLN